MGQLGLDRDLVGGMLRIGIERQQVGKAGVPRQTGSGEHRGSFAEIPLVPDHAKVGFSGGEGFELLRVPSSLPSQTTQTGSQQERASRTVSNTLGPVL